MKNRYFYQLVGLSALWQIGPWLRTVSGEAVSVRRDTTR